MRGRKHLRNTREYMLLRNGSIFIFVCIFILIGTGYSLLNTQIEIQGKSTMIENTTDPDEPIEIGNSTAKWSLAGSWAENYVISLEITNKDQAYDNWTISFDVPQGVNTVNVNNQAEVVTTINGNTVTIKKVVNDWATSWGLDVTKDIQIHLIFDSSVTLEISNLVFNNKLITSINSDTLSTNEDTTTDLVNNIVEQDNVVEETNNIINNSQNSIMEDENQIIENSIQNTTE